MTNSFNLSKVRDFGEIITDTFTYIRTYWKSLGKAYAVYVLAPLLLGVVLFGGSFGSLFASLENNPTADDMAAFAALGLSFIGGMVLVLIALFMMIAVTYQHVYLSGKGDIPNNLSEFSEGMFSKAAGVLGVSLVIAVVFGIVFFILLSIITSVGNTAASIIGVILIYAIAFFVFTKISLYPAAYFVEGGSPFNAIGRSWELTDNNWWFTFGVYFVINFIFSMISILASFPFMIIGGILAFAFGTDITENLGILIGGMYATVYFFQIIASSAQFIALGIHYFNLVERKEGSNINSEIELLGL